MAFALMGVAAATTAGSAYLLGEVINKAYVDKDVRGIAILSLVTIVIFTIKGAATYGHTVILSQIGNAILANNQRRLFAKLMSENIAFFSERHSSEFLARLTAGATAVTQVLNLLINADRARSAVADRARRRDGDDGSLDGAARLCGGAAGDDRAAQAGQAHQGPGPQPVLRHRRHHGDDAGIAAGHPHGEGVHAGTGDARAHRRQHHRGRAQRQQDGAGLQPLQPADGDARRLCDRRRADVWRLPRGRDGRFARAVLLVPDGVPAGL